jgi:competence protein ComEC
MDAAIVQGFSTTGISHILSVSGLHVAIIYGALSFLLSLFDRCNRFHVFRSVFLILFLIFYAFLTGLTPSVCRSAFMLSIHAFGKSIRRHPFGLNTVLISALVLLMYQPLYVLDLGFQLSYLSVFSLIAIFSKLGEWIQPKSVVVKKVWEMSGISIVAQLATAPLTMSVFHTFPNYFLLNNFFAVPASSLLLYLSGGVLLLQDVPWIGVVLSKCLSWGSALFLESTVHSASLPGALTSGLYFNVAEVLSMYLIICCLCFLLYTQKRCWMVYALLGVLLFQCLFWFHLTGF